jgi:hypothetical protein
MPRIALATSRPRAAPVEPEYDLVPSLLPDARTS